MIIVFFPGLLTGIIITAVYLEDLTKINNFKEMLNTAVIFSDQ